MKSTIVGKDNRSLLYLQRYYKNLLESQYEKDLYQNILLEFEKYPTLEDDKHINQKCLIDKNGIIKSNNTLFDDEVLIDIFRAKYLNLLKAFDPFYEFDYFLEIQIIVAGKYYVQHKKLKNEIREFGCNVYPMIIIPKWVDNRVILDTVHVVKNQKYIIASNPINDSNIWFLNLSLKKDETK